MIHTYSFFVWVYIDGDNLGGTNGFTSHDSGQTNAPKTPHSTGCSCLNLSMEIQKNCKNKTQLSLFKAVKLLQIFVK